MSCSMHVASLVDPFSLHVSFDVNPHLSELDKNITTSSFQYHNVCYLHMYVYSHLVMFTVKSYLHLLKLVLLSWQLNGVLCVGSCIR